MSRSLSAMGRKLFANPFFPAVFWGKVAEALVTGQFLFEFLAFAVGSTVLWVISDAIEVDVAVDEEKLT